MNAPQKSSAFASCAYYSAFQGMDIPDGNLSVIMQKKKGGRNVFELLEMLATFAYNYGVAGANMASLRGNHEVPVPDELIGDEEE